MLSAVTRSHNGKASKNGEIAENGKTMLPENEEHMKKKTGMYFFVTAIGGYKLFN